MIDYDTVLTRAKEVRPRAIIAGASAYSRAIDYERFREIADEVDAYLFADIAHPAGLIATGLIPTSIPYAHVTTTTTHKTLRGPRGGMILTSEEFAKRIDKSIFPGVAGRPAHACHRRQSRCIREALTPAYGAYAKQVIENAMAMSDVFVERGMKVISGGTDTHLLLLDVDSIGMSGKQAEKALEKVGITVNKNTIPGDPRPPTQASGIRIGSPAVTTRGFGLEESRWVGGSDSRCPAATDDEALLERTREEVREVSGRFPLPGVTA